MRKRASYLEFLAVVVLLVGTVALFRPGMSFPAWNTWDDDLHITANSHLAFSGENLWYWVTHPVVRHYIPLTMYSYMADYAVWGRDFAGFHWQSLCWHLAAVLLVYRCFRLAGIGAWWAWLAAACFAWHPQRVESVVWLSERKDVLCAAFYLLAVYCYWRQSAPEKFNWLAWGCLVLALGCKPMAVSLPAVFMLLDYSRQRRWWKPAELTRYLPYWLVVAAVMLLTWYSQVAVEPRPFHPGHQALVILHNFAWYTTHILWPGDVRGIYPLVMIDGATGWKMAAFYGLLAGWGAWVWRACGRDRWQYEWLPLLLAYAAALAPTLGIFHLGIIDYADRYAYLPSFFLLLLLLRFLVIPPARRHVVWRLLLTFGVMVYVGGLAWQTVRYLPAWRDYQTMLRNALRPERSNEIVVVELGLAEARGGHVPEALALASRLESGIDAVPGDDVSAPAFYAGVIAAMVGYGQGRTAAAADLLRRIYPAMAPRRYYAESFEVLVLTMTVDLTMRQQRFGEAQNAITRLLRVYEKLDKDYFYYYYRGLGYGLAGKDRLAAADFQEALRRKPNDVPAAFNLRHVLERMNSGVAR